MSKLPDLLRELTEGSPDASRGELSARTKLELSRLAIELGPDQCQALYHSIVYMTRVA